MPIHRHPVVKWCYGERKPGPNFEMERPLHSVAAGTSSDLRFSVSKVGKRGAMNTLSRSWEAGGLDVQFVRRGLDSFLKKVAGLPAPLFGALAAVSVICIGVLDYATGEELSFSLFYLGPVLISAWVGGRSTGIAFCILSAIVWLVAEKLGGRVYSISVTIYWNGLVRLAFFLLCSLALSKIKEVQTKLLETAREDPLTGALNARGFYDLASLELLRSNRSARPFTVMYLDLDHFKSVNDTYGHSAGDNLLREVVNTIKDNIRKTDLLARMGGDEFVVLLPETPSEQGHNTVKRIHERVCEVTQRRNAAVTASLGAVNFIKPPVSVDAMIREVDTLMYAVKKHGKNKFIFTTSS